jgi:hypothetical protein
MPFTVEDLDTLKTELTGDDGLIDKIDELANATEAERSQKIVPLIGAIIGLVITAIKAAMD